MPVKAPAFWQKDKSVWGKLLSPFGFLFSVIGAGRFRRAKPYRSKVPVICIGNLVMGGVGKTPLAVSVAEFFKMNGLRPVFLTRGYGGGLKSAVINADGVYTANETGDEAQILARIAPVVVSADRKKGAIAAEKTGADVIIMDDGFQNPQLEKDLSFAVFDGRYGFGNGKVFPAGPLREKIEQGLERADACIIVGADTSGVRDKIAGLFPDLPCFYVHIEQDKRVLNALAGQKVFAFAGIGYPAKFFGMLSDNGIDVVGSKAFSDHHPYSENDMEALLKAARGKGADHLITTAKDGVRVPEKYREEITVIEAYTVWDTPDEISDTLVPFLRRE